MAMKLHLNQPKILKEDKGEISKENSKKGEEMDEMLGGGVE